MRGGQQLRGESSLLSFSATSTADPTRGTARRCLRHLTITTGATVPFFWSFRVQRGAAEGKGDPSRRKGSRDAVQRSHGKSELRAREVSVAPEAPRGRYSGAGLGGGARGRDSEGRGGGLQRAAGHASGPWGERVQDLAGAFSRTVSVQARSGARGSGNKGSAPRGRR